MAKSLIGTEHEGFGRAVLAKTTSAIAVEHHAPMTAQEHMAKAKEHRTAAAAAMNPSERDAHHGAARAHTEAAEMVRGGTASPSTLQHVIKNAHEASKTAHGETELRQRFGKILAETAGKPGPEGHAALAQREAARQLAAKTAKGTLKANSQKAAQTGPRGGSYYISSGGTKIYRR